MRLRRYVAIACWVMLPAGVSTAESGTGGGTNLHLWLIALGAFTVLGIMTILLAVIINRQRRQLRESSRHYHNLLDAAVGHYLFRVHLSSDGRMHMELASRSMEEVIGHSLAHLQQHPELILGQLVAEDQIVATEAIAKIVNGQQSLLHLRLRIVHPRHHDQRHLSVHATAMPTSGGWCIDGLCIDVTAVAAAEAQSLHLQQQLEVSHRRESLGLLASGVAHDFNNILSAIRGNAELVSPMVPEAGRHRLERLFQAVDRASGLVRQILAYSGRGTVERKALDLGKELTQIEELVRHALPKEVTSVLSVAPSLPPVLFDPAQFQQVVVNLIVNAAESYQGQAGTVTSSIDVHEGQVRMRVTDAGCGMDAATQARIFDPYFTTKEHGHGLGLAAVQGIIRSVDGTMTCDSSPGKGTTFTLLFNFCSRISMPTPLPIEAPVHSQYVLVADDDDMVREISVEMLGAIGYTSIQADSGQACLDVLHRERHRICAVVLDCRMPDLDGPSVLKDLRNRGDRIPVVLISGMVGREALGTLDRRTRFLAKPFTQAQLSAALDALFGSQRSMSNPDDSSRTAIMVADVIRQRQQDDNRSDAQPDSLR